MKARRLLPLIMAGVLAGCASSGTPLNTPHAVAERAESDAETAYQGTVDTLASLLAAGKIDKATHDADWNAAWTDLQAVRTAYNAGQTIGTLVGRVQADQTAAKGIK